MLKTKCIPFYADNNSSNLPFYLLQDARGNDVIYINDKNMIYTNSKNITLYEQMDMYTKCLNQGICYFYRIDKNIRVLKKHINKDIYWYLLNGNDQLGIYKTKFDNLENVNIYFNDKYFCLTSMEYGEYVPEVVAGYDIKNKKLFDCEDYQTGNYLYKSLVEVRRCRYDCICSILQKEILIDDEERLFSFLSFILNKKITKENYMDNIDKARFYVLKKYPKLINLKIEKDKLKEQNKLFGINHFYFNRLETDMPELKYKQNKTYVKA